MSSGNNSRNNSLLLGVGILAGIAGTLLGYFIAEKRKQQTNSKHKVKSSVSQSVSENENRSICSSRTGRDTEDDFFSALGSDVEAWQDLDAIEELTEDENNIFQYEDGLMKGDDQDRILAFNILEGKSLTMSDDPNFLWRFAKAHQIKASMCQVKNDLDGKKTHILEGLKLASRALELDESNPDAHKWFAVLTGMLGELSPVKDKLEKAFVFQKHILEAIKLKPRDYSLYHLLGRFKFELAKVTWLEKKMALAMFGEIPEFTYSDAVVDFMKAEELNPDFKANKLLIAKCFINEGKFIQGVRWLKLASAVPAKTMEEKILDNEITELLNKHE